MYISERPNRQVPVPHKFHPGHEKRISNEFIPSEISRATKNETHIDSKAYTEASFSANKRHASILEKESQPESNLSMSMNPNYGTESEITVNKESVEEGESLRISDFNNESPIRKNRDTSDFDMKNYSDVEIEYTPHKKVTPVKIDPKKSSEKKHKKDESTEKRKQKEDVEDPTDGENPFTPRKLDVGEDYHPIWQSQKVVLAPELIDQDEPPCEDDQLTMKVMNLYFIVIETRIEEGRCTDQEADR